MLYVLAINDRTLLHDSVASNDLRQFTTVEKTQVVRAANDLYRHGDDFVFVYDTDTDEITFVQSILKEAHVDNLGIDG